jgi:methionyl aminopeptidase
VENEARRCGFSIIRDLGGHGVGRSIHEEPKFVFNYYNPFDTRQLTYGLVITIEPFLSTGASHIVTAEDGWTLKTDDGSLSAQYEHTVVVTDSHPIVLTAL